MNHVNYRKQDVIGILTINRPEVLNALNHAVLKEMLEFLENRALEEGLKAIILTGEGEKAFIAGADIKEIRSMDQHQMLEFCELGQEVAELLETGPFLTVAAVNGYAFGGGLEMALACDLVFATASASIGLPEVTLGLIPGFGGTQRLTQIVGAHLAKEIIFNGKRVTAQEAQSLGLINHIVKTPETLIEECSTAVKNILKHPFGALMKAKIAIHSALSGPMEMGMEVERNLCARCLTEESTKKALDAFLEKRVKG